MFYIKIVIQCALFDFTYIIFYMSGLWYLLLTESDEDNVEKTTTIVLSNKESVFDYFEENVNDRDYMFDVVEATIDIFSPNDYKIWSTFFEDDIQDLPPFKIWFMDKIKKYINFYENLKSNPNDLKKILISHTYNKMTMTLPAELIQAICKYI